MGDWDDTGGGGGGGGGWDDEGDGGGGGGGGGGGWDDEGGGGGGGGAGFGGEGGGGEWGEELDGAKGGFDDEDELNFDDEEGEAVEALTSEQQAKKDERAAKEKELARIRKKASEEAEAEANETADERRARLRLEEDEAASRAAQDLFSADAGGAPADPLVAQMSALKLSLDGNRPRLTAPLGAALAAAPTAEHLAFLETLVDVNSSLMTSDVLGAMVDTLRKKVRVLEQQEAAAKDEAAKPSNMYGKKKKKKGPAAGAPAAAATAAAAAAPAAPAADRFSAMKKKKKKGKIGANFDKKMGEDDMFAGAGLSNRETGGQDMNSATNGMDDFM